MDKRIEKKYLIEAINYCDALPETPATIHESESPDFVLKYDSIDIGVEVTSLYRGKYINGKSIEKEREVLRNQVIDKARKRFGEMYTDGVHVEICWKNDYRLTHNQTFLISENIAALVKKMLDDQVTMAIMRANDLLEQFELDNCLYFINAVNCGTKSIWNTTIADFFDANIENLQLVINKKNKLIDQYLSNCNECFLLIVADGSNYSSLIDVSPDVLLHKFQSSFRHTYLLCINSFNEPPVSLYELACSA